VFATNLKHDPQDQRLERQAISALTTHDPFRFRRVNPQARSGVLLLTGSVSTFYAKSLGAHLVRKLPGVAGVVNALEVRPLTTAVL
jgi:osmotically-inducible protein OsmY